MWSGVLAVHRTTSYRVRKKPVGKAELIAGTLAEVVGAMPPILSRARKPVTSQPNVFCPAFGLAPHAAEWYFCAI